MRLGRTRIGRGRLIQKTLEQEHRAKIKDAVTKENGIWRLVKWAQNREGLTSKPVPALRKPDVGLAERLEEKLDILRKAFFPKPPEADLSDINGFSYPPGTLWPDITEEEVKYAI